VNILSCLVLYRRSVVSSWRTVWVADVGFRESHERGYSTESDATKREGANRPAGVKLKEIKNISKGKGEDGGKKVDK